MESKLNLKDICQDIRSYAGVLRKNPIGNVFARLQKTHVYGSPLPNFGDDAAIIPWDSKYLLLAADGMMIKLLIHEPYAAGKAAVLVTVNDIYSMGGRPLGMVNVLASGETEQRDLIVQGIEKGCHKLKVPMLGGHLHPDAEKSYPSLSVAILGWSNELIRSHLAVPGDDLILAVDLNGRAGCWSVISWDANSGKSSHELLRRLDVLPQLAERRIVNAGKDISNAGILGTLAIMMENSGQGAIIDIHSIPKPPHLDMSDWLLCFQSYGFVLSVPPEFSELVSLLFEEEGITASVVGSVTKEQKVVIRDSSEEEILFDFERECITGIKDEKISKLNG